MPQEEKIPLEITELVSDLISVVEAENEATNIVLHNRF